MASRLRYLLVSALALIALALALAVPGTAAASAQDVLNDCFDDDALSGNYSNQELRDARKQMQADFEAYSECDDIIDGRLQPKARTSNNGVGDGDEADAAGNGSGSGGGSGGSGSGSFSVSGASSDGGSDSPEEAAKKRQLARADTEATIGGRAFDPKNGAAIGAGDTSNGLPLAVLLALIALTLLLVAGALLAVHQRNPALMGALRRAPFSRSRRS